MRVFVCFPPNFALFFFFFSEHLFLSVVVVQFYILQQRITFPPLWSCFNWTSLLVYQNWGSAPSNNPLLSFQFDARYTRRCSETLCSKCVTTAVPTNCCLNEQELIKVGKYAFGVNFPFNCMSLFFLHKLPGWLQPWPCFIPDLWPCMSQPTPSSCLAGPLSACYLWRGIHPRFVVH